MESDEGIDKNAPRINLRHAETDDSEEEEGGVDEDEEEEDDDEKAAGMGTAPRTMTITIPSIAPRK